MFSLIASEFSFARVLVLLCILAVSALMSGLSGFGFSAIGALCLWLLPPKLAVPLLMSLSTVNQLVSLRQLKAQLRPRKQWWPDGPAPYLLGGCVGAPVGLVVLHSLPTSTLVAILGGILIVYAAYSMFNPQSLSVSSTGNWPGSVLVGAAGGVIGGFTAFPGAAVVIWAGLLRMPKGESRAIVQPYILGLQVVSLAILAVEHPETFNDSYWALLLIAIPVVLPCTLLGGSLYKSLSDFNFRRVTLMLLGASGLGLLAKAAGVIAALPAAAPAAVR